MRGYATFFLIAVMSLGLVFLLVTRDRTPHDAPAEVVEIVDGGDAGRSDAAVDAAAADAAADAAPARPVERPLRVTALGWELVAAGAALASPLASPPGSAPAAPAADAAAADPAMPAIELAPETSLDAVEARLARGGADPVGADVAILPLPSFVVAFDRLRALDPRVFAVVGFSRGREELHAAPSALLKLPPGAEEVKLVALGPATAGDAAAKASGSDAATLLGLFALDLLGVPPARLRFVAPTSPDAKAASFAALVHGATDERKLALSTTDANRLIPIVAVAPRAQLDASEVKMRAFTRAWLDGLTRASADASGIARRLANKEGLPLGAGIGGAPEAIALLGRLGHVEPATLAQQRTLFGPEAKGAYSLETLTQRTWSLTRAAGSTPSSAASPLPIDARIVTAIAPAPPAPPAPTPDPGAADGGAAGGAAFVPLPAGTTPLVVYRAVDPTGDVDGVALQIGFLAGVFENAAFRVSAKGGEAAARSIAAAARDRHAVPSRRLSTVRVEPTGAFAVVEVLALP